MGKTTNQDSFAEWNEILTRAFIRTVIICGVLYGAYWVKSALGINLSQHYHAIDFFSDPVQVITDILNA